MKHFFLVIVFFVLSQCFPNTAFSWNQIVDWNMTKRDVLRHYQNTPEKLKAAKFLIENIPYHYSYAGEVLDKYYEEIESINRSTSFPESINRIEDLYGSLGDPNQNVKRVCDADLITSEYLIKNIDRAFDDWKGGHWANQLSFNEFCEYLLPYKIGEERIEQWRDELRNTYLPRIEWMYEQDDKSYSAYWAALYLNDQIKKMGFHIYGVLPNSVAESPLKILKNMKMGECNDYAKFTAYAMRACGIPVGIDFTPQWPFRSSGHYWNTLIDNSRRTIPFMGGESNPGYPCKSGYLMAKVFRRTFAYQKESLYALNDSIGEDVPYTLNNPFIKDVTDEYVKGVDVTIDLGSNRKRKNSFIYLSVFDNQSWIPVDYSKITSNGEAKFKNVGGGIVYLPTFWGARGSIGVIDPIEVKTDGSVVILTPDTIQRQTIKLSRKFPVFGNVLWYSNRMLNGYFEASNSPDFSDAIKCAVVKRFPAMRYDSVMINPKTGNYRFWRYVSPNEGYCNVAEIQFLHKGERMSWANLISDQTVASGFEESFAFDNDELTFYESNKKTGAWIGVDMGKAVQVDMIHYLPRNDDNNVVPGHTYELCYYENGREKSTGLTVSKGYELIFQGVPTNALYILHDRTKGTEERIFTYNNGTIKWY
jgi:hypothetical protein